MTLSLSLRNRQRTRAMDMRCLRQVATALLRDHWPETQGELGIVLVCDPDMTRLNETFVHHQGSTDVITFDYAEEATTPGAARRPASGTCASAPAWVHGEIFICVDEALRQARRFRTGWQSEITRYLIHGLLHLQGFDDLRPAARRRMKQAENQRLRRLAGQFDLRRLNPPRARAASHA